MLPKNVILKDMIPLTKTIFPPQKQNRRKARTTLQKLTISRVSYETGYLMVKHFKPLSDDSSIKECIIKMAQNVCPKRCESILCSGIFHCQEIL